MLSARQSHVIGVLENKLETALDGTTLHDARFTKETLLFSGLTRTANSPSILRNRILRGERLGIPFDGFITAT